MICFMRLKEYEWAKLFSASFRYFVINYFIGQNTEIVFGPSSTRLIQPINPYNYFGLSFMRLKEYLDTF